MSDYYVHNGKIYSMDELKHYKYIKREKKNGKWRYYYYDKDYEAAKKKSADLKKEYDDLKYMKDVHTMETQDADIQYYSDGVLDDKESADLKQREAYTNQLIKRRTEVGKQYVESKNVLKQLNNKDKVRKAIAKGTIKVANYLSKGVAKAVNFVSKAFKKKKKRK